MTPTSEAGAWAGIVGQPAAVALLQRAIALDRLAHAYAFVGPSGVGRRLTAVAFAQAALCAAAGCGTCGVCRRVAAGQYPDCHLLTPTPPRDNPKGAPMIRIEQIRELERTAALAPHEAGRKVFVLDEAERMTLPTAQALLKTLEEPPPRTHLVLIIANPRALPPTLLSRCQRVRFGPLSDADAARLLESRGVSPAASALLARLAQGCPGVALATDLEALRARREAALALAAEPTTRLGIALDRAPTDRATVATYLELYWFWYRDALCLAAGGSPALLVNADQEPALRALAARIPAPALTAALARVKAAWVALETNMNPRLALETALLGLGGAAAWGGMAMHDAPDELEQSAEPPRRLIGVRLREGGRADDYLVEDLVLRVGDHCLVEVPSGHAVGQVRRPARDLPAFKRDRTYPRVLRVATPEEVAEEGRRREREVAAVRTCQLRAQGRGLALKVVDVELTRDGRRVTVLFAAETRIDFRELVRDLAREFRARIEMRQVGARDVTKVQDGIGPCGRQLCCSTHLRGFEPVSVKMAKSQDVPLNDSRLLGNCGRLKCCLLYEFSQYEALRAQLPRVGSACQAECGGGGCMEGRVRAVKVLKESVLVGFADGTEAEVPLSQLTWEGRPHVKPLP